MRRVLRIVGKLLLGLVVLVVLGFVFIHTPWGKSVVRGFVESKLADKVTGKVTVGSIDYSLLFRSIELHDVEIRDGADRPAITVAVITADLDRGSLLHGAPVVDDLVVDGVSATIIQNADGTTNLTGLARPSSEPPPASIEIIKMSVRGAVHVTRADGTTIEVTDLALAGRIAAKPRVDALDVVLGKVSATATITKPGQPAKQIELAIAKTTLGRHDGAIDVDLAELSAGPLSIAAITGHVATANGALAGDQSLSITKARVDHDRLSRLLGSKALTDDVAVDVTVAGPPGKLAIQGAVEVRRSKLALTGTADMTAPARPRYDIALVGKGESRDVVSTTTLDAPDIQTDISIHAVGSGITRADLDAMVTLAVGPTHIGSIAVGQLTATAHANHGALALDQLDAHGLGFTIHGAGRMDADARVHGNVTVAGSPAEALSVLREAGIAVPIKVPPIPHLEIGVSADGFVDGKLALAIEPAKMAIAGGHVAIDGTASLDHRKLQTATTTIAVRAIDIDALVRLAGKPAPKVHGSISGKLVLTRTETTQHGAGTLTIALREPALTIVARTDADLEAATLHADLVHGGTKIGTIAATLAHDNTGILPAKPWHLVVDVPARALSELAALAPHPLPIKVPDGEAQIHADIAGTPRAPTGTIDASVSGATDDTFGVKHATVHADITSSPRGIAIGVTSSVASEAIAGPLASIAATVQMPSPYRGGSLDLPRLTAGVTLSGKLDIPERELSTIPNAPDLGGRVGGSITASGTPKAITIAGTLGWRGYPTAAGDTGATEIQLAGTPADLAVHVRRDGIDVTSKLVRAGDRTTLTSHFTAAGVPVAQLLPAKLASSLDGADPGLLDWNMDAAVAVIRGPDGVVVEPPVVTGTLSIHHGAFAVPHTTRRWHDIDLEVAGDPAGVRLTKLELHEDAHRTVTARGLVSIDHLHPRRAELDLAIRNWLMLGKTSPLFGDAPTATVDLDAGIVADLTQPIVAIDATISKLAFINPDRQERGHQPEISEVSTDVIYVSPDQPAGKLPVSPAAEPHHRRPIDVRVHLPVPIHALRAPFDVMAHGDVSVAIRDDGVAIRGNVAMDSGTVFLFGRFHELVSGSLAFTDEHPKGWFHVVAERKLPPEVVRDSTRTSERLTLTGSPAAPAIALDGAAGATIPEVLSTYNAGHPIYVTGPDLPASSTVEMPRGDQMLILGFVSLALPHLLFLDSIEAWADPSEPRGAYGRIRDLEADRYFDHRSKRVRAVGRPTQPGRSTAELQLDQLWLNDDHACFGAGLRAGDRLGGGLGLFFEWSSAR
jgi:hypothetical protein